MRPANSPIDLDLPVRQCIRQITIVLIYKYLLRLATIWCFVWGVGVLVLRTATTISGRRFLWGALGFVIVLIAATIIARRRVPSRAVVRALIDQKNRCGGLLMASGDVLVGDWQGQIAELKTPKIRYHSLKAWGLLFSSVVFIGSGMIVPIREVNAGQSHTLAIDRQVSDIAEQIETLKEEQVLEGDKSKAIEESLDQLRQNASGEDPAKTWEALDHLSNDINQALKNAAESAVSQDEKLAKAEALSEGLKTDHGQLDSKLLTESMKTLAGMIDNAMAENQALAAELSPEMREAVKSGNLETSQLKELTGALGRNRAALDQKMAKLSKATQGTHSQMIDTRKLKGGASGTKPDNQGLAKFLKENAQRMSVTDALGAWCENGKGGIDRGRGDAG